jgi:hypothetical protein
MYLLKNKEQSLSAGSTFLLEPCLPPTTPHHITLLVSLKLNSLASPGLDREAACCPPVVAIGHSKDPPAISPQAEVAAPVLACAHLCVRTCKTSC